MMFSSSLLLSGGFSRAMKFCRRVIGDAADSEEFGQNVMWADSLGLSITEHYHTAHLPAIFLTCARKGRDQRTAEFWSHFLNGSGCGVADSLCSPATFRNHSRDIIADSDHTLAGLLYHDRYLRGGLHKRPIPLRTKNQDAEQLIAHWCTKHAVPSDNVQDLPKWSIRVYAGHQSGQTHRYESVENFASESPWPGIESSLNRGGIYPDFIKGSRFQQFVDPGEPVRVLSTLQQAGFLPR